MTKVLDFRRLGSLRKPRGSALLGLVLDGSRLDGVMLRRTNGSLLIQQTFSVALSLDPLTNDPQLVGREIRNHLDTAGVRERRCVVGLPLKWALTTHTQVPDIHDADLPGFLQIEAERGFPCDVALLHLAHSRYACGNANHAALLGVPRNHVAALEQVLRSAQLRPVSFSLGLTALQPPAAETSDGVLALAIGESHVGLQVTSGGGLVALRALEGALETEGGRRQLQTDLVAREVRITLAQMPAELRGTVRRVRIFGPRDLAQQLADGLELRLEAMELQVEVVTTYREREFGVQLPPEAGVSPALSLAARHLVAGTSAFEFLPPRVSGWQRFASRYSSGTLQRVGVAAGALLALVALAFLFQQVQLWRVQSQWSGMSKQVRELQDIQARIKQFRGWADESVRGLTILRCLTEAFPEDGSVTAKTLEIRDLNTITCTGTARDYQALLKTVERLRKVPQIGRDVSLGQTRGQSPTLQFSFSFVWSEGGNSAN